MRALLLKQYKELEVTEMPEPAAGPDDVRVAVKACGICGSDVHGYHREPWRRQGQTLLVDGGISTGATKATVPEKRPEAAEPRTGLDATPLYWN